MTAAYLTLALLGIEENMRADHGSKSLVVWFKSTETADLTIRITGLTWNWCPTKETLPIEFTLRPGSTKTLRFNPKDLKAMRYGDRLEISSEVLDGGQFLSQSTLAKGGWQQPGVGILTNPAGKFEATLTTPEGVPPCEIKDFTMRVDGKAVTTALKPPFKKPALTRGTAAVGPISLGKGLYELPPATSFVIYARTWMKPKLFVSFKWRQSPWAPWAEVITRYP